LNIALPFSMQLIEFTWN